MCKFGRSAVSSDNDLSPIVFEANFKIPVRLFHQQLALAGQFRECRMQPRFGRTEFEVDLLDPRKDRFVHERLLFLHQSGLSNPKPSCGRSNA
jgi:hypothetical protein